MSFIDSIKGCFSQGEIPIEPSFRVMMFGESAVFIENVKSIGYYDENEMLFLLKKGGIKVLGQGLYIKKYCAGDVAVCGKIRAIERA